MSFDELSVLVEKNATNENLLLTNLATMIIMLIWTFGVFDAYKLGKEIDQKEKETP